MQNQNTLYEGFSYPPIDRQRTPTANDMGHHSRAQYKDRVLSWSHTVYIDLLSYLHQNENGQYSGGGFGPLNSKQIYPRPPLQSAVTFPSAHAKLVSSENASRSGSEPSNHFKNIPSGPDFGLHHLECPVYRNRETWQIQRCSEPESPAKGGETTGKAKEGAALFKQPFELEAEC